MFRWRCLLRLGKGRSGEKGAGRVSWAGISFLHLGSCPLQKSLAVFQANVRVNRAIEIFKDIIAVRLKSAPRYLYKAGKHAGIINSVSGALE